MSKIIGFLVSLVFIGCSGSTSEPMPETTSRDVVESETASDSFLTEETQEDTFEPDADGSSDIVVDPDTGSVDTGVVETPIPVTKSVRCKVTGGEIFECGDGKFPKSGARLSWTSGGSGYSCGPTNYMNPATCDVGRTCSVFIPASTNLLGECL